MIIGKLAGDFEKGFIGKIETLTKTANIELHPAKKIDGFTVFLNTKEVGVAFTKTSKAGNPYLSLVLDDPFLEKPINCIIMENEGEYAIFYKRNKK